MNTKLSFTKMHGCGNDYIFIEGANIQDDPAKLAIKLTNRNKSIGGDGIVLVLPSDKADAKMRMFNADGSEGQMCGNSIRCMAKYLHDRGSPSNMKIETASGIRELSVSGNVVQVNMGLPELAPEKIPVALSGEVIIARKATIGGQLFEITCLSMGNPHCIIFHQDIEHCDLATIGQLFEKSDIFPQGINLGVVQMHSRNHLQMRVWERGTGETLSSGTGACAAVVAATQIGYTDRDQDITADLAGGRLTINYTPGGVLLSGEVETAFKGDVFI